MTTEDEEEPNDPNPPAAAPPVAKPPRAGSASKSGSHRSSSEPEQEKVRTSVNMLCVSVYVRTGRVNLSRVSRDERGAGERGR